MLAHAAASRSTSKAARARRLFSFSPPLSPLVPTAAAVDHQLSSPRWMCLASARAPTVSAQPGTLGLWSRSKAVVSSGRDGGSAAVACPFSHHFIGPPEKHRKTQKNKGKLRGNVETLTDPAVDRWPSRLAMPFAPRPDSSPPTWYARKFCTKMAHRTRSALVSSSRAASSAFCSSGYNHTQSVKNRPIDHKQQNGRLLVNTYQLGPRAAGRALLQLGCQGRHVRAVQYDRRAALRLPVIAEQVLREADRKP